MMWNNLLEKRCPNCVTSLIEYEDEYACASCSFIIDVEKFKSIVKHRLHPLVGPAQSLKWQNILDGMCPLCAAMLHPLNTQNIHRCENTDCNFSITKEGLERIIRDRNHPAYKFYKL